MSNITKDEREPLVKKSRNSYTMDRLIAKLPKAPPLLHEFLAEMMGTFILVCFGLGSVAQWIFFKNGAGEQHSGFLSVNFGFGLGVALGVYWSAGVSGGHINPSVTLALAVMGRLPLIKLPVYWAGQTVGAFLGSAVVYGVYYDLISSHPDVYQFFSPNPYTGVSNATGFGDQLVGTALLVACIFALIDKRNNPPAPHLTPFIIGMVVLGLGASFGGNAGYGLNPARDLVPRIFTAIVGWDGMGRNGTGSPFETNDYWFWIPIVAQLLGGVIGALLYVLTIEMHHKARKESFLDMEEITDQNKNQVDKGEEVTSA